MAFALSAGPLRADGHGTISLASHAADLDATLAAPAMMPRPPASTGRLPCRAMFTSMAALTPPSWMRIFCWRTAPSFQGVAGQGTDPGTSGRSDAGHASLTGLVEKVVLPGSHPDLIADAPVRLTAQADLKDRTRPVRFTLVHPLMRLQGLAQTAGALRVTADLAVPSLAPFAALAGTTAGGDASFHLALEKDSTRTQTTLDGRLDTKGKSMPARLLGNARLSATAVMNGADLVASHVQLQGADLKADVQGTLRAKQLNTRFALDLHDLSRLANTVHGSLSLQGAANGPIDNATLSAGGNAVLATKGFARQRVNIELKADALPRIGNVTLALDGRLDDAPLAIHVAVNGAKARQARLNAHWRSFDARADINIGAGNALAGKAHLSLRAAGMTFARIHRRHTVRRRRCRDFTFSQQHGKTNAAITAGLTGRCNDVATLETASMKGRVSDVLGKPGLDIELGLHKMAAQGWSADAQSHLQGSLNQLDITLVSGLTAPDKSPLKLHASASLDVLHKLKLTWKVLNGVWHNLVLGKDAPATLHFANGLAVDHLSRPSRQGAGSPPQDAYRRSSSLTASANGLTLADFFKPLAPHAFGAQGMISAQGQIWQEALLAPSGHIALQATNLRTVFSRGLPPANVTLAAQLMGDHALVQVHRRMPAAGRLSHAGRHLRL